MPVGVLLGSNEVQVVRIRVSEETGDETNRNSAAFFSKYLPV